METPIQVTIISSPGSGERVRITRHSYSTLCEWERDTEIGVQLHGWQAAGAIVQPYAQKRKAGQQSDDCSDRQHEWETMGLQCKPPHEDDFKPVAWNVERFIVTMANPKDYRTVKDMGSAKWMERIGTRDNMLLARHMAETLSLVKQSQLPLYEQIDYRTGNVLLDGSCEELNLSHCLLPVANEDGNVTSVFSVRRYIGSPQSEWPPPDLVPEVQSGKW